MPRKRMKGPQRRTQLMAVAQRLFAHHGYSLTTTAAIAEAAGVTEPIIYRHFKSKRDLFLQLLDAISKQAIAELKALADRSSDPLVQLDTLIRSYPSLSERFAEPFAMIDRSLASLGRPAAMSNRSVPDVRPLLAAHYRAYEKLVGQIVGRGQATGQIRADIDPVVIAWYLIHAALGWRLSHNLALDVFRRQDFVPQSARLLLDGLLANARRSGTE